MRSRPVHHTFLRVQSLLRPVWVDVERLVYADEDGLSRREARDWSLVLEARRVPHRIRRVGDGWSVRVLEWHAEAAEREIRAYLDENREGPAFALQRKPPEVRPTALFLLLLSAFFTVTVHPMPGAGLYPHQWLERGSANAWAILHGEWWRLATSLTLHADGAHLLGNVLVGGAFAVILAGEIGSGLAWLGILLTGVLGNLINTLVLGAPHDAIGFSTAVFGTAGMLAGFQMLSRRGGDGLWTGVRTGLVPVGAGLGLLAMLGSGGENTDLGAHLFGFGVGLALGLPSGLAWGTRRPPGTGVQAAAFVLSLAALAGSWVWAFAT